MLLEIIKARIDAINKPNAAVSKLELEMVLVKFSKTKQTNIIPEALAYAQAAGINLELDLTHYTTSSTVEGSLDETWSPSFGRSPERIPVV